MNRIAAALPVIALLSCSAARIPPEELPADPIAFMRQEAAAGISQVEEFIDAVRIPNPDDRGTLQPRRTTTLSLLDLRSGESTTVPGVGPGVLPMDWSADGYKLLIGRYERASGGFHLSLWNRATGSHDPVNPSRSAGSAALGQGPIRGAQVGRVAMPGGGSQIGVHITLDHRGTHPLPGGTPGRSPDISPDGRTVVFERPGRGLNRDGTILLMRLGDAAPRPLGRGSEPRFSRDGKWIGFLRRKSGQTDVWLMRADGTGKRALTNTIYDEQYPAVSPTGRYVVFASVRPPNAESQLYLVRVSDGREIQLTQAGQNSRPLW